MRQDQLLKGIQVCLSKNVGCKVNFDAHDGFHDLDRTVHVVKSGTVWMQNDICCASIPVGPDGMNDRFVLSLPQDESELSTTRLGTLPSRSVPHKGDLNGLLLPSDSKHDIAKVTLSSILVVSRDGCDAQGMLDSLDGAVNKRCMDSTLRDGNELMGM